MGQGALNRSVSKIEIPGKTQMDLTTDKLPLVKQRLYETMALEDKGVGVNHTLQQTAMISRPHIGE